MKKFSIEGAVGIAIGLIGTGVQWRWPEKKGLGFGLIIIGGLLLLVASVAAIVRSLTIKEYERLQPQRLPEPHPPQQLTQTANPHNEFKPTNTFQPTVNVSVPVSHANQQQVAREQKATRDPVFECRGTRLRRYGFNMQTGELIREQYDGDPAQVYDHIRFVDAALARFLYRADPGVDPRLRVNAHVFIYGGDQLPGMGLELTSDALPRWFKNKRSCDIYKSIWDDDEPHVSVEFSAGYTHELIVALIPAVEKPRGIIGYEHETKLIRSYMGDERVFTPEIHNLNGSEFVIKVELIPKLWNDVRCRLPAFWFRLSLASAQPVFSFVAAVDS